MKFFVRTLLTVLAAVAILYIATVVALSFHDSSTKQKLLRTIRLELPAHASMAEMHAFMRRHTDEYSVDDDYNFELGGFVPQTKMDRLLLDRKVGIYLKFNRQTKRFERANVEVFYTFL